MTDPELTASGDPGDNEPPSDPIQAAVERKRNIVGEAMVATGAGGFLYLVVFLFVMAQVDLSDAWGRLLLLPVPLAFVACAVLRIWKHSLDVDARVGPIQRSIKATIARLDVDIAERDRKDRRAREHPADPKPFE
jgi:hypothetical protein